MTKGVDSRAEVRYAQASKQASKQGITVPFFNLFINSHQAKECLLFRPMVVLLFFGSNCNAD